MSMIGNFKAVPDTTIDALLANPSSITSLLYPEGGAADDADTLDIDKAWHGIHFLLCGEEWGGEPPLNFIMAGEPIGDVDVGYGPARALRSAQVKALAQALEPIDSAALKARFDPEKLAEASIYPQIWDEGDEAFDYLDQWFQPLKQLIRHSAEKGHGLLIWLN